MKEHKKLYKAGKKWLVAMIVVAGLGVAASQQNVLADDGTQGQTTNTFQVTTPANQNNQNYNSYSDEKLATNQVAVPDDNYNDLTSAGQSMVNSSQGSDTAWNKTVLLGDADGVSTTSGFFNSNVKSNIVSSEANMPLDFKPGILVYDGSNDTSEQVNDDLTENQKEELNDLSNKWTNSLRNTWRDNGYNYDGSPYQYKYSINTNQSIWNDERTLESARTSANYSYNHTGLDASIPSVKSYVDYLSDTSSQISSAVQNYESQNNIDSQGVGTQFGENLFMLSGSTMLQLEVDLYNKMQSMLWSEAVQDGSVLNANSQSHLGNALNNNMALQAMSFQKVASNHWYLTWDFIGAYDLNSNLTSEEISGMEQAIDNISPLVQSNIVNRIETLRAQPVIQSGWEYDNGNKYYRDNSGNRVTGWKTIDGQRYYFDPYSQVADTGLQYIDGNWYYFDYSTSAAQVGLQNVFGSLYSFDASNYNATSGWQWINGNMYYFDPSSYCAVSGVFNIGNQLYYFDPDSHIQQTGWITVNGKKYYFNDAAVNGLQNINGNVYYFSDYGLVTNQKLNLASENGVNGGEYFFDDSGVGHLQQTGWQKANNRWYYRDNNGLVKGWRKINNNWYYFDPVNAWARTGWQKIGGHWYYFDAKNAWALKNWQHINNNWYYFDPVNAWARTGLQKIGGHEYYFDLVNAWALKRWQHISNNWYYFDPVNVWAFDGLQQIGGHAFYFINNKMVANRTIYLNGANGLPSGTYKFDANGYGKLLPNGWIKNQDGSWSYKNNNQYINDDWKLIGNHWYYFDYQSKMVANTTEYIDYGMGKFDPGYYTFDVNGHCLQLDSITWKKSRNAKWMCKENGTFLTGWHIVNGKTYYFDPVNNEAITGWFNYKGNDYNNGSNGPGWYYFDPVNASALTGWQKINSFYYYLNPVMETNTIEWGSNNVRYYIDSYGHWVTKPGWQKMTRKVNGSTRKTDEWLYVNHNGSLATNRWVKVDGVYYYFTDPFMAHNQLLVINGTTYEFDSNGHYSHQENKWFHGNQEFYGETGPFLQPFWYYLDDKGNTVQGWKLIDGAWYYFRPIDNNVYVMTALSSKEFGDSSPYATADGRVYAFDVNGHYQKNGWFTNGEDYWYLNPDGTVFTGLKTINGIIYYFIPFEEYKQKEEFTYAGRMAHNEIVKVNNKIMAFDKSGRLIHNGWFKNYNWYYISHGEALTNRWLTLNGVHYYFDSDGHMYSNGNYYINGSYYNFDANGYCLNY